MKDETREMIRKWLAKMRVIDAPLMGRMMKKTKKKENRERK